MCAPPPPLKLCYVAVYVLCILPQLLLRFALISHSYKHCVGPIYRAFMPFVKFLEQGTGLQVGSVPPREARVIHIEKTLLGFLLSTLLHRGRLDEMHSRLHTTQQFQSCVSTLMCSPSARGSTDTTLSASQSIFGSRGVNGNGGIVLEGGGCNKACLVLYLTGYSWTGLWGGGVVATAFASGARRLLAQVEACAFSETWC